MKVTAIVYTSNTGFTRAYAALLGEATGLPVYDMGRDGPVAGAPVLYLGWLRAGGVVGLKKAARRWKVLGYCGVGMGPAGGQDKELAKQLPGTPCFYLRGGYDGKRLKGIDRVMMSVMERVVAKQAGKNPTEENAQMLQAVKQGADWVSRAQLEPVLEWLHTP